MNGFNRLVFAALAASLFGQSSAQAPQGTAFTYQGELRQNGTPVVGSVDLVFQLYDGPSAGNQIGPTLNFTAANGNPATVTNGTFTVALDFGALAFNTPITDERYLQVTVNGNPLAPRTKVESAPYALQSRTAELAYSVSNASVGTAQIVPSQVQQRVAGSCALGSSIQSIAQNGSVTCQPVGGGTSGTVTSVDSGPGLTGGPITSSGTLAVDTAVIQQRVTGTCAVGSYMRGINADGTVQCTALSKRTVFVTQVGTPQENGTSLLAALAGITATAADPWLLKVDVGVYDLGTASLNLSNVSLEGSGESLTTITSAGAFTVRAISPVQMRELTVSNTANTGVAVYARSASSGPILLTRATLSASNIALNAGGDSQGIVVTTLVLRDLTIVATKFGILDGSISASFAPANQLTASEISITTPAVGGVAIQARLSGWTSKPHFMMDHSSLVGGNLWIGDSDTFDQFQIYFSRTNGGGGGFTGPSICSANTFGFNFAPGNGAGC